ncbi:MAG: hypothetical protein ACE5GE_02095 [Phycisphaerae bacterium]
MKSTRRRVLDVGNCNPDHGNIRHMLEGNFDVDIDRVMFVEEALARLGQGRYDLVMVNRLIFDDGSDGGELIRRMQAEGFQDTPVMLISNYDDAQQKAQSDGAVPGFGKANIGTPETLELLGNYLCGSSNE